METNTGLEMTCTPDPLNCYGDMLVAHLMIIGHNGFESAIFAKSNARKSASTLSLARKNA